MGFFEELDSFFNVMDRGWSAFNIFKKKNKLCDDYYYEEYNKKVYVKKNGDGVIVSSFILKVIDPVKTDCLIRTLDISDAKKAAKFEDFRQMANTPMEEVFEKPGFWYTSDGDIITDVEEFYNEENARRTSDEKFISIKISIDTTKLKAGQTYNLSYAFSVPGLFPIHNGRFDMDSQDRKTYNNFISSITTDHIGHHLRFSVYFEDGIVIKEKPLGHAISTKPSKKKNFVKDKKYNCIYKNNIFYKKYHFEVENPQEYEYIYMGWNVKNPES
jgi:hypothetical protein